MSEQVTIYGDERNRSEAFQMMLNKAPARGDVKSQTLAGKEVKYMPIGLVEKTLDEMYNGLWQITDIRHTVTLNAIAVELTLQVYHPTAKLWLSRAGVGAIKVQLNKDAQSMDVTQIKADAIQKGLPAAKAMAVKNAAQSLGVVFGRDLNRDTNDEFIYLSEQVSELQDVVFDALRLLDASALDEKTKEDIKHTISTANLRKAKTVLEWLKKGATK